MTCPGCGTENDDNDRNCKFCGRDLHPVPDPAFGDQQQPAPPPQPTFSTGPQPGMGAYDVPPSARIPTYLVPSILSTLFCCLPAGVVGIIYAAQVNGKLARGDVDGAMNASRNAKMWTWISFGLGLTFVLIGVVTNAGTTTS